MKRLIWVLLAVVVIGGVTGWGQLVAANTVPPPGLAPRAYACYESCVLPNYIVADDFDMDGWLDLAVSCVGNNVVDVYSNNGNGIFSPAVPVAVNPGPIALIAGHIGGYDGLPDIGVLSTLTVGSALQPVTRIPNGGPAFLGGGVPVAVPTPGLPKTGLVHMTGGYFDNNNLLDIAVAVSTLGANQLYVYDNAGAQITPGIAAPIILVSPPVFVSTADFDQNGWPDIAVLCAGNPATVTVYYNNGGIVNGAVRFTPVAPWSTATVLWQPLIPTGMDVGDFNADGYPDLVVVGNVAVGTFLQGYAQVLLNSVPTIGGSPIGFNAVLPAMQTWGFDTRFVEVADFDGNGRDDFAAANYGSDTVTIFLTDGLPLVQDNRPVDPSGNYCLCEDQRKQDLLEIQFKLFKIELECGHFPIGLAAGDFDRNGKIDLAVALQSASEDLCAQNPSCLEIDFDIACGFNANQKTHSDILKLRGLQEQESEQCVPCKDCGHNTPPKPEIQTESESKN